MDTTTTKARLEHGIRWADSQSGKIRIALGDTFKTYGNGPRRFRVWALYNGTHDLAPVSRDFRFQSDAEAYANRLWRTW